MDFSSSLFISESFEERLKSYFFYVLGQFEIICKILVSYAVLSTKISDSWPEVILNSIFKFLGSLLVGHIDLMLADFCVVEVIIISMYVGIFPAFDPVIVVLEPVWKAFRIFFDEGDGSR